MEIKKFEKYKWDIEKGNIAEEYAKVIISKYIDNDNFSNTSEFEKIYIDVINGDELDEDQAYIIKSEIIEYLKKCIMIAKKIRPLHEINAEKYNL